MKTLISILLIIFVVLVKAEDVAKIYSITNRTNPSNPGNGFPFKNKFYFTATNGINGTQIWALDSTEYLSQIIDSLGSPFSLIELNGKLFFFTGSVYTKKCLWEFNGVDKPVILFNDIDFNSYIVVSIIFNNKFYFYGSDDGLYVFDGINHPTKIANGPSDSHTHNLPWLTIMNNKLYFRSDDGIHGNELWCCDSSNTKTIVADINPSHMSSGPRNPEVHNNKLYFYADDGVHGYEMWEYDGVNEPGMIADIYPGSESSSNFYQQKMIEFKDKLYFKANEGINGADLWVYDGINPPEEVPGTDNTYPSHMFVFNDKLYFYNCCSLCEYDGINAPKILLNSFDWDKPVIFKNNLYIWVPEGIRDDLYRYDGINPPKNLTSSIFSDKSSIDPDLIILNNKLYFVQYNQLFACEDDSVSVISNNFPASFGILGQYNNKFYYYPYANSLYGSELWSFDGVNAPSMVSDINKTIIVPTSLNLKKADDKLYFTFADSIEKYIAYDGDNFNILSSDFNPLSVYNLFSYNNNYYFNRESGKISVTFYKFDGTTTTALSNACGIGGVTVFKDNIYYCINFDGLYKYDGVTSPLKMVDLKNYFTVYQKVFNNRLLYFTTTHNRDSLIIWEYDGLNQPTLIQVTSYINDYTYNYLKQAENEFMGKFYYLAKDTEHGTELWSYDGVNVPILVADIRNGVESSNPLNFKVFKNKLYFTADDGTHGTELWVYDGINSPKMVYDIESGSGSSSPTELSVSNNKLYFTAYSGNYGTELWGYDGENKPYLVSDIYKGSTGSGIGELAVYKNNLYLSAVTKEEGRQLYKVDYNCSSIDTVVCKNYNFNGTILSVSGRYYDYMTEVSGNDSIIRLDLTILEPITTSMEITACNHYELFDKDISESGIYTDTIPSYLGCDSIITIHLTVNHSTYDTIAPVVCETYTSPSGKKYTSSGTYFDTVPNSCGCDSILTINLTVNHNSTATQQVKTCNEFTSPSSKYIWKESGTYLDTIPNACGCDSIIKVELNLQHIDPSVSLILEGTEIVSNDTLAHHQWVDCDEDYKPIAGQAGQSFTPTQSGNYAVVVSYGWCSDTSECTKVNTTGMEPNPSETGIKIYPNPTSGKFSIDLGREYEDADITITELDGRVILKKKVYASQIVELDLNAPAGIYTIVIITNPEDKTFKIFKRLNIKI